MNAVAPDILAEFQKADAKRAAAQQGWRRFIPSRKRKP